jgi:hypothetical protein
MNDDRHWHWRRNHGTKREMVNSSEADSTLTLALTLAMTLALALALGLAETRHHATRGQAQQA